MSKITLKNVRLSFPSLWRKAVFDGKDTKYEATFLLDKEEHAEKIAEIDKAIKAMVKEALKGAKLKDDKICLRDGDLEIYDGYKGCMSFKASNGRRPLVIDRDRSPLTEDDGKPYAGCYVNATVELWVHNNQFGKRINANLLGVQFVADGEAFGGGGSVADVDDFEELEDDLI